MFCGVVNHLRNGLPLQRLIEQADYRHYRALLNLPFQTPGVQSLSTSAVCQGGGPRPRVKHKWSKASPAKNKPAVIVGKDLRLLPRSGDPSNKSQLGRKTATRFPELARLTKLTGNAVKLRRNTTSGLSDHLANINRNVKSKRNTFPQGELQTAPKASGAIVPGWVHQFLPVYRTELFILRAFPPSLLRPHPQSGPIGALKPFPSQPPFGMLQPKRDNVSLHVVTSKRNVHASSVIREKVATKIKQVIRLIVERGADAGDAVNEHGEVIEELRGQTIVQKPDEAGLNRWLLSDWTYVVHANLELYRHPIPGVITEMRKGLSAVRKLGEQRAIEWAVGEQAKEMEALLKEERDFDEWVEALESEAEEWRRKCLEEDSPAMNGTGKAQPKKASGKKDENAKDRNESEWAEAPPRKKKATSKGSFKR